MPPEFGHVPVFAVGQGGYIDGHQWAPKVDTSYISNAEWTRMDTNGHYFRVHSCPMTVEQGFRSAKGFGQWLPEAKWPVNQVKAAGIWSAAVLCSWPFVV